MKPARLSGGGVASFEAARQATGNQNKNGLEIKATYLGASEEASAKAAGAE